jgi:esterase/lipase
LLSGEFNIDESGLELVNLSIIVENITFNSEGCKLIGRVYKPAHEGKFPAVVMCHGYPGDTKSMDLAEELALNNIVALIFYYQGAWGSEGTFRFTKLEPSTRDAVAFIRTLQNVIPERVGLISHSMGAVPLVKWMGSDFSLKAAVLLAPVSDLSSWASPNVIDSVIPHFIDSAKGKLEGMTLEQLRSDLNVILQTQNPVDVIQLIKAPLLVVVGSNDDITSPELCRNLYERSNNQKKWHLIENADHTFSEHRAQMIKSVVEWLQVTL